MKAPIYQGLIEYCNRDYTPWHMPGHKRDFENIFGNPYALDVTEVPGLDDLHDPQEMIKESMDMLKEIYQTEESYYLVNGSTVGILVSLSSIAKKGDYILVGRNCHKSVFHGIALLGLQPIYLMPEIIKNGQIMGEISVSSVEKALSVAGKEGKRIAGAIITSPTYEGVLSDIKGIAEVLHKVEIPLIVDEAHGAHLIFAKGLPESAVTCGADLVVQSTHKTMPAFTQTALLHRNGSIVDGDRVKKYLSIYQTSSPSYLLMASTEYAVSYMWTNKEKIDAYVDNIKEYRKKICDIGAYELLDHTDGGFAYDEGKFVLFSKQKSGVDLAEALADKGLIVEMIAEAYVIIMTSVMDKKEKFDQLIEVLENLVDEDGKYEGDLSKDSGIINLPVAALSISDTLELVEKKQTRGILLSEAKGFISADFIYVYPPGSPILVPGELIDEEQIEKLELYVREGLNIKGLLNDYKIRVVIN